VYTYNIQSLHHLAELGRADIRAVGEAKVDERVLAKVLVRVRGLPVLVNEVVERTANLKLSDLISRHRSLSKVGGIRVLHIHNTTDADQQ
jgi:hypothetical protein